MKTRDVDFKISSDLKLAFSAFTSWLVQEDTILCYTNYVYVSSRKASCTTNLQINVSQKNLKEKKLITPKRPRPLLIFVVRPIEASLTAV